MTLAAIIFASASVGATVGFFFAAALGAGAREDERRARCRPMSHDELIAAGIKPPDWYREWWKETVA